MPDGRAIVRVMPLPSDDAAFYVDNWEQADEYAEFTLPVGHPLAKHLYTHCASTTLAVASTVEVEWVVTSINWHRWTEDCTVSLKSRTAWVKSSLLTDEYLVWLGAVS